MSIPIRLSRAFPSKGTAKGDLRVLTLQEVLNLIDRCLPKERRHAPHWHHAREAVTRAMRSKNPAAIEKATTELERAMRKDDDIDD